MPSYEVLLEKDNLVFSAAHFITFNGNVCEQLHGHNYRVRCRVVGPLDENGYVIDFIALRDTLMEIVGGLDHRMLLPTQHPTISVEEDDGEIVARFEKKRWVFPAEDCVLLPIANTTAELLASWIGAELIGRLKKLVDGEFEKVVVSVDENRGQWANAELDW
jgi:6-pyruvoyltetrahydropterin/6-carboxytetrahydropterin synthase